MDILAEHAPCRAVKAALNFIVHADCDICMNSIGHAHISGSKGDSMAYESGDGDFRQRQDPDQSRGLSASAEAQARDAAEQASHAAREAARQTTQAARDAADQARQAALQAREAATSIVQQQKDYGAEQMEGLARAAHGAAEQLEEQLPMAAHYVHDAAARLEQASATLRERSIEELLGSVTQFARSQPAVLFGGAIVAGFALSRFLKASRPTDTYSHYGMATPRTRDTGMGDGAGSINSVVSGNSAAADQSSLSGMPDSSRH
jgi:hypothetical protein